MSQPVHGRTRAQLRADTAAVDEATWQAVRAFIEGGLLHPCAEHDIADVEACARCQWVNEQFGAGPFRRPARAPMVFAIRPVFVDRILAGTKTIELRTRRPRVDPGDTVLIYESRRAKAVVASAQVVAIYEDEPDRLWSLEHPRLGIDRASFDAYFAGRDVAYGLRLDCVRRFAEPVPLPEGQSAPQAWARWRGAWPLLGSGS